MTEADIIIETSPFICGANQWTGFYMISASVMKGLRKKPAALFLQVGTNDSSNETPFQI